MFPSYTDWWYTYPSAKYEFVTCDYYSQDMEKSVRKTTKQPRMDLEIMLT